MLGGTIIIENITYRNLKICVEFFNEKKNFCATSPISSEIAPTYQESIDRARSKIDEFFEKVPENYEDLAKTIENDCTVWTGYEDCHIDVNALEILIENFMRGRGKNKESGEIK